MVSLHRPHHVDGLCYKKLYSSFYPDSVHSGRLWYVRACHKNNSYSACMHACWCWCQVIVIDLLYCNLTAVSGELRLFSVDDPDRTFANPARIKVGNALDVAVELRCSSVGNQSSTVNWAFAENDTAVPGYSGLGPFGTSQREGGLLRIYPVNVLSQTGTGFQCRDVDNDHEALNVTLELRKFPSYPMI